MWQPSWAVPREGFFFPPTLFTDVAPSAVIAQVEIFGPVLVSITFRTPAEAVALANNTRYGLAASVWTENINLALDVARKIKAGTVWINSTNLFDGASGFGGYRESGFGREGGREGMWEYLRPQWAVVGGPWSVARETIDSRRQCQSRVECRGSRVSPTSDIRHLTPDIPPIDRTPKMYIGGKQSRPDAPYGRFVYGPDGRVVGEVGEGSRKDIRNAVEAARAAEAWGLTTGHARAQILYYIAENLESRAAEFSHRIAEMTGDAEVAWVEVNKTVERLFSYAAWADKYDGWVHHVNVPHRDLTIAIPEPVGVVGIACPDEFPLLAFVSLVAPAMAMGNTVVAIPSQAHPLAATDFYQVLDTSDVPGGVVNIVTGERDGLAKVLAQHDDVDALWYFGTPDGGRMVEHESATNMKRTWVDWHGPRDWLDSLQGEGEEFLRCATQVKNIWAPYGE
jgi:aldehyde dehydrogenase (NAD+)